MPHRVFRLMSIAVLLGAMLATALPAAAQTMGVKGGFSSSHFRFDGMTGPDQSRRTEFSGGVFYRFGSKRIMGHLEGLVTQRGSRTNVAGTTVDTKLLYYEIPFLLRVNVYEMPGGQVYVGGGWGLATRWRAQQVVGNTTTDIRVTTNAYDTQLLISGGAQRGRILIDGRYTRGLRNLDQTVTGNAKVFNEGISITAGFEF